MRAVEEGYRSIGKILTKDDWTNQTQKSQTLDGLARLTSAVQ